jgi:hypothetical protein
VIFSGWFRADVADGIDTKTAVTEGFLLALSQDRNVKPASARVQRNTEA